MTPRAAVAIAAAGLLVSTGLSADAATRTVRVGSFFFEDATRGDGRVVVQQGDRITFTFEGKAQHTATVDGIFTSGTKSPGQRYTTPLLTRVGTFTLYCQVHGAPRHGTALVVRRKPSPAPAPSPTRARPSPTKPPSPKPSPSRVSPSPTPSAVASPTSTPAPTPSATTRAPSPAASVAASPTPSLAPVAGEPPDVMPAAPIDDSGPGWLLPAALLALLAIAGAAAIALGRRRQRL